MENMSKNKKAKKYGGRNTLYKIYKVVVTRSELYFVEYWGDTWAIFPSILIQSHILWRNPYDVDWETVDGILIREGRSVGYLYIPTVLEVE